MEETWAPRNGLMRFLDDAAKGKVIYFFAPAGYGKSVSANLWMNRGKKTFANISLDRYDNTPSVFCRRFCGALIDLERENAAMREVFMHPAFDSDPEGFTIQILGMIRQGKEKRYLVLDDLHDIENAGILKLLPVLIKRLPGRYTVFILSRAKPPESFSDMLAKGGITLIGAEQARFGIDDIRTMFRLRGRALNAGQAQHVQKATGGWAIALNALLLSGQSFPGPGVVEDHLEGFIRTEVWDKWDGATQDFMLETAVVKELSAGLCEALTGREDSLTFMELLLHENAFIRSGGKEEYVFHPLFREFLLHLLENDPDLVDAQLGKAAEWYFEKGECFKALEYFNRCRDMEGVIKSFRLIGENKSPYFVIEHVLQAMRLPGLAVFVEKQAVFLPVLAWAAFMEGRVGDFAKYADRVYENIPEASAQIPEYTQHAMFIRCLDYRTPLKTFAGEVQAMGQKPAMVSAANTITQNMPLFHRSSRDFSEYVEDMDEQVAILKDAIGDLFGEEREMLEECLKGGLLMEQGRLEEAHKYIMSANGRIQDEFAPEMKFCAMVLLAEIFDAQNTGRRDMVCEVIGQTIKKDRAYYLNFNFAAYVAIHKFLDGDVQAAEDWLKEFGTNRYERLPFFRLCGHFATARAYITVGRYDGAIMLLNAMLNLCETYRRPLDVIEACVLLAVSYWQKKRGHQNDAMAWLERAVQMAYPYGYTQVFAREGADVVNMLHRLYNKVARKEGGPEVPAAFIKRLYLEALQKARVRKGMTSGNTAQKVKFTARQKEVMRLLCEGSSYQHIADELGVKFSTIRSHIELIYRKLDVPNEVEAVMKIKELGILDES